MQIGEKLKEGRLNKKMTQEDVSEILHVSRSTVSSWEVNRTYPDLDLLVAMSDLYDLSLDIILREDNKLVENIVKETKKSKKRKGWIIALLIIFIPIILFLGYQLWNTGLVVSVDQIDNVEFELNGEELNSESRLTVDLTLDNFHEYGGYWSEVSPEKDTIVVQLYQNYGLSGNDQETLTIPMDFLEFEDFQNKIEKIEIKGFNSLDTKIVYFKN